MAFMQCKLTIDKTIFKKFISLEKILNDAVAVLVHRFVNA